MTITSTFHAFPQLPTELRLKIWSLIYQLTPPQLLTLSLQNSDLDYLRLNRKACHDAYHICALKARRMPVLLHICSESRTLALQYYTLGFFDSDRILSLGRGDTDVDTYTTCSHEVSVNEQSGLQRGIYWDRKKDVVFLDSAQEQVINDSNTAYIWGGKTGVRFGRMGRVVMSYATLIARLCGVGQAVEWESVESLYVFSEEVGREARVVESGKWVFNGVKMDAAGYVGARLQSRGLLNAEGEPIEVKFEFGNVWDVLDYVTAEERLPAIPL